MNGGGRPTFANDRAGSPNPAGSKNQMETEVLT